MLDLLIETIKSIRNIEACKNGQPLSTGRGGRKKIGSEDTIATIAKDLDARAAILPEEKLRVHIQEQVDKLENRGDNAKALSRAVIDRIVDQVAPENVKGKEQPSKRIKEMEDARNAICLAASFGSVTRPCDKASVWSMDDVGILLNNDRKPQVLKCRVTTSKRNS